MAAGRDGCADAGERLPALGDDGARPACILVAGSRRCSPSPTCGGRSCSPSDAARWSSAVCGRFASTTSSCSSPSAPSASSGCSWSCSAPARRRRRPPAGCCSSPTRRSRPRCSWWSASSTTRPEPATSGCFRRSRGGWRGTQVVTLLAVGVDGRRAARRRVRRQGARVRLARRRTFRGSAFVLAVVVVGSMLTVAYARPVLLGRLRRSAASGQAQRRDASSPTPPVARLRRAGRASSPSSASSLGVVPSIADPLVDGLARRVPGRCVIGAPVAVARLQRSRSRCRRSPSPAVPRWSSPTDGCSPCWRVGVRIPSGAEVYLAAAARASGLVSHG